MLLSRLLVVYERGVVGHLPSNEESNKLGGRNGAFDEGGEGRYLRVCYQINLEVQLNEQKWCRYLGGIIQPYT